MILRLIDKYGKAAAFAKRCGFTMITIHAGHGWLPAQFMSSKVNTRNDKWGGNFENRMRFTLAVIESVRKAVGSGMPIECRFSGSEVTPDGYDISEGVKIAKAMDGKVDILHVSAGIYEIDRINTIVHPSLFLEVGCNSKYAREIRKNVSQSLVATVGAFTNPEHMEEFLASGGADIIEMARQSMADPDLPIKARSGRDDEIARCLRCNKCASSAGMTRIYHCALNPEIGYELDVKMTPPVGVKKKVLVIGGGISGMEAAIRAAKRGHEVILCEKSDKLGGVLNCQEKVPFKKNIPHYIKRQIRLLEITNVDVRLNTEVSPLYAASVAPDVIIAALGARPIVPKIPGIESALGAEEVFLDPEKVKGRVAILGAGLVGIELAIWLAQLGHEVDIIEMADKPGVDYDKLPYFAYRFMIEDLGIRLHLGKKAAKIEKTGVDTDADGILEHYEADSVIYAVGQRPLAADADAFAFCASEFHVIGDCLRPESILEATRAGYAAACDIGKV
jgi:NADPH-dependent 2,4-dienoyl-CoA reductase/sulfur reductase-like enzyme